MIAVRWLALPFCASLAALVFVACKDDVATGSTAAGTGGTGGVVEMSGNATSGTPTSGSAMPDAGPLTCKGGSVSTITPGECDLLAQDCGLGRTCKPAP